MTPLLELLASPWHQALDRLLASVRDELVLVSPFITRAGTERVLDGLACAAHVPPPIHVITDLSVASLLDGSLDPAAIVDILDFSPSSVVSIAPRLHAKAYIADTNLAIITSANLTQSGLYLNKEYGVLLRDRKEVQRLRGDVQAYAGLGNRASRARLEILATAARAVRGSRDKLMKSARRALQREFRAQLDETATEVLRTRADGKTTHGIFRETVLYLLEQRSPLATTDLHRLVQNIHPDLCDDTVDRVIGGVHFGKRWKHYVRNAQQDLKRRGKVTFDGALWRAL